MKYSSVNVTRAVLAAFCLFGAWYAFFHPEGRVRSQWNQEQLRQADVDIARAKEAETLCRRLSTELFLPAETLHLMATGAALIASGTALDAKITDLFRREGLWGSAPATCPTGGTLVYEQSLQPLVRCTVHGISGNAWQYGHALAQSAEALPVWVQTLYYAARSAEASSHTFLLDRDAAARVEQVLESPQFMRARHFLRLQVECLGHLQASYLYPHVAGYDALVFLVLWKARLLAAAGVTRGATDLLYDSLCFSIWFGCGNKYGVTLGGVGSGLRTAQMLDELTARYGPGLLDERLSSAFWSMGDSLQGAWQAARDLLRHYEHSHGQTDTVLGFKQAVLAIDPHAADLEQRLAVIERHPLGPTVAAVGLIYRQATALEKLLTDLRNREPAQ